jgi:peptide/nickel transport system permease protein
LAFVGCYCFGILFGIISALHKDTWIDRLIALVSTQNEYSLVFSAICLPGYLVLLQYTKPEHDREFVDDFGEVILTSFYQWF